MSSETTQVIHSEPRSSSGKFLWVAVWFSLLMIISGVGHTAQTYYVDATNGDDNYMGISEAAPWQTLAKVSELTYQPGDKVLLKRGKVWTGHLEVGEDSDGDASNPITFGAYGSGKDPIVQRLTLRGDHAVLENLVIDHNKETGDALRLRGAKNCILRHLIVRNGLADGIDAADADGLLVDSCLVHHFLAGSFTQQADAHGIVVTDTQGLIIRNTEVHHVSGDSFQADPNRNDTCDDILIEDCYFWTNPLSEDFNERWFAGQTPGENAIDTKVSKTGWESARRMRINIRNLCAHGWINDGFISIRAAFNMKEKIEVIFDGVTVYDCHVAFRLRGSLGNANVTLTNAVICNCEKAIRAENGLSNLRIYNSTFGSGIDTQFQIVAGDNSRTWDIRNNVFIDSKHAVASANSNRIVNAHDFADNSRRNYHPKHEASLMDAVEPEGDDTVNGVTTILRAVYMGGANETEAGDKLLFLGDFEKGDLSAWRISGNSPTVTSSPTRAGRYAMKTSLDRYKDKVSYRTEVSGPGSKVGGEYWYGFSIFLPDDYVTDNIWEIVAQWHGVPDFDIGENWRNPVMALSTNGGKWSLVNRWDAKRNTFEGGKRSYGGTKHYDFGQYEIGVWTDWVVHVKWSYKFDGILEIWKNRKKVVDQKGPNTFNDAKGPYFKMGIYKGWKNPDRPGDAISKRVLYHDEFRMAGADASYTDVAPGGE